MVACGEGKRGFSSVKVQRNSFGFIFLASDLKCVPTVIILHAVHFKYSNKGATVFFFFKFWLLCCWYPKEPGRQHSNGRDEGRLGRRRLVVNTDPKIVPDLKTHVSFRSNVAINK